MHQAEDTDFAPRLENSGGAHPIVLVCEHASARLPDSVHGLGLNEAERLGHIAWDPGAFETARHLSGVLDAPLIYATASRLLYDCNRPPEAESAIPDRSEDTAVPGNAGLSQAQRQARAERYYKPFERLLSDALDQHPTTPVLVTIHSFTPVFHGQHRTVEVGILHDQDSRLADALLQVASGYDIRRNAPYGPDDGVTHTLRRHGLPRGILNVMIEIRNDLVATPEQCTRMAETLAEWLRAALALCSHTEAGASAP